jgi:hypothetical protein
VLISQPGGLTLTLSIHGAELHAGLSGGELVAKTSAKLDRLSLAEFFVDASTMRKPPWGRWEYKGSDDAIVLHAGPTDSHDVLLTVSLLASSPDAADWQVDATLIVPALAWASVSHQITLLLR